MPRKPKVTIHNQVKARIYQLGFKMGDVARAVGISKTQLSRICSGDNIPSLPTALRLAKVLQCHVDELFWEPSE